MKFKVGVFKVEHKADIDVEAKDKVEAALKAGELLDTENGTYILVAELDSPSPAVNMCMGDVARMINTDLRKKCPGYVGNNG